MTEHLAPIVPVETETSMSIALRELIDAGISTSTGAVAEKLLDAMTLGFQAEFDPAEAEAAGAFPEDALSEADALASSHDALHFPALSAPMQK